MSVRRNKNQTGFTIVEVLIVLAVAGLIMMLVFIAIPALARAGRNSQRKQDVAAMLSAVSHYELNHGGNFPACTGNACATTGNFLHDVKLSFYTPATVTAIATTPLQSLAMPTAQDDVYIYNYYKCVIDPVTGGVTADSVGAGYHDAIALYNLEQSNGMPLFQCKSL